MANNFAYTFKFAEIWEDYTDFKEFTDALQITEKGVEDPINELLFDNLTYRYYNRDVNYELKVNFKRAFAIIYKDEFKRYKKQYEYINKLYDMSLEELISSGMVINNSASNPMNLPSTPYKPLDYVVNQTSTISEFPKLERYLQAIDSFTSYRIEEFCDKFKHLFTFILIYPEYYFNND